MASSGQRLSAPRRAFSLPAKAASNPDIDILYALPSARIIAFSTSRTISRPSSSNGITAEMSPAGDLAWGSPYERTIAVGTLSIYRAPSSVSFLQCQKALRPILKKSQAWCVDGEGKFVLQIRPPEYWRIEVPYTTPEEISIVDGLKEVLQTVLLYEKTTCPFKRPFQVELPEAPQTPVKKKPWKPVDRPRAEMSPLSVISEPAKVVGILAAQIRDENISTSPSPTRRGVQSPKVDTLIAAIEEQIPLSDPKSSLSSSPSISDVLEDSDGQEESVVPGSPLSRPTIYRSGKEPITDGELSLTDPISPQEASPSAPEQSEHLIYEGGLINDDESSVLSDLPQSIGEASPEPIEKSPYEATTFIFTDEESDGFSDATDDTPKAPMLSRYQPISINQEKPTKPHALQNCNRSITAPPVLSLITSPPSKHTKRATSPRKCSTIRESSSDLSSSADSFHSVMSWHSPLAPPSPPASGPSSPVSYPYPHENISLPKRSKHNRDLSELTVTPETPGAWSGPDANGMEFIAKKAILPTNVSSLSANGEDISDASTSETSTLPIVRATIRNRTTTSSNSRRRELSPLPPAVNLFSPRRQRPRKLQTARHLPTAIIQKTYEILISPPSHLFQIMLKIASKIAAGEWRGVLSGYGEDVHWDFDDEYGDGAWFEDDYGISLPNPRKTPPRDRSGSTNTGGSWGVD